MRLLIESAMMFFGTLMAAALVALGGPRSWNSWRGKHAVASGNQVLASASRADQHDAVRPLIGRHEWRHGSYRRAPQPPAVGQGARRYPGGRRPAGAAGRFFPWDWLRGPLNRYVSDKTGRHFEITRKLDVKLGRTTRILADGIEFANPEWASDPHLVKAEGG